LLPLVDQRAAVDRNTVARAFSSRAAPCLPDASISATLSTILRPVELGEIDVAEGAFQLAAQQREDRDLSLQCADANVVPGAGMASYLSRRGISEERIWIRHNWSDGTKVGRLHPAITGCVESVLLGKFVVGGPTISPPFSWQRQY
jgi:hypothetical protein